MKAGLSSRPQQVIAQEAHWSLEEAGSLQIPCSSAIIHAAVNLKTASSELHERLGRAGGKF
jgi:hypothetical protein